MITILSHHHYYHHCHYVQYQNSSLVFLDFKDFIIYLQSCLTLWLQFGKLHLQVAEDFRNLEIGL